MANCYINQGYPKPEANIHSLSPMANNRTLVSFFLAFCVILPFCLNATNILAENNLWLKEDIQKYVSEYEAHHSLNYLECQYLVIYKDSLKLSGFGTFQKHRYLDRNMCGKDGYDCYWLDLSGKKILPSMTDSIFINGTKGIPNLTDWNFTLESSPILAIGRELNGDILEATIAGEVFSFKHFWNRAKFREKLKAIPEAYSEWDKDVLNAIRIYNRSSQDNSETKPISSNTSNTSAISNFNESSYPYKSALLPTGNENDFDALARSAEFDCSTNHYAKARATIEKMIQINPNHYTIPFIEAKCLENSGSRDSVESLYDSAMQLAPNNRIIEINEAKAKYKVKYTFDSTYANQKEKLIKCGLDLGLGLPYSFAGIGLSLHLKIGAFQLAILASEGIMNLATEEGIPTLGLRVYSPGKKYRGFIGILDQGLFDSKLSSYPRFIGPEVGLIMDIGKAHGFYLNMGAGLYFGTSFIQEREKLKPERNPPAKFPFPFLGVVHEL